jgi:hypothetical protein
MKQLLLVTISIFCVMAFSPKDALLKKDWVSLFDGTSLNGWKVGENASTFSVDSGMIIVHGKTAHLFYDGKIGDHSFKNFEFKADVKTMPGANSGIYFHSQFQQASWPEKG